MNYWIVRGRPRENDFPSMLGPKRRDYWRTAQPPRGWSIGDRLVFWASSPQLEVVGFGRFRGERPDRSEGRDTVYRVEYDTTVLPRPLGIDELRANADVSGAIFLKNGPARSVERLSVDEGEAIYRIALVRNRSIRGTWPDLESPARNTAKGSGSRRALPDIDLVVTEGAIRGVAHFQRERDRRIVHAKKKAVLAATGKLACEVCGFDSREAYGELGRDLCEVHHTLPLADLATTRTTGLGDLAVVCSNCHRAIRRTNPMLTITDFAERIRRFAQHRSE